MVRKPLFFGAALLLAPHLSVGVRTAGAQDALAPQLREFVTVDARVVALRNVKVIDGTGAPARDGQTIVIEDGRIAAVGPAGRVRIPRGAQALDLKGHTVIPASSACTTTPSTRQPAAARPSSASALRASTSPQA